MIKSGESLEFVIDALVNGKKIKNSTISNTTPTRGSISPSGRGLSGRSTNRLNLKNRLDRSSLGASGSLNNSRYEMSPAERSYRQQKDRIFGDMKKAILSKYF